LVKIDGVIDVFYFKYSSNLIILQIPRPVATEMQLKSFIFSMGIDNHINMY